ncbi:putative F-box protein At3g16210 [Papaver somniferum]|uniref:putative F-box protein At3g16210 n=1 Tax=Papaver somniferum TaxID=3469 RepID=UPI000E6F9573|nr:putative F-box protein At3g16210 [Papaver somniferum]
MRRFKFNDLPKEMMLQILSRLPVEFVLISKLVCRQWRDLIRHPSFYQEYLDHLSSAAADDDSGKLGFIFFSYDQGMKIYYIEHDENSHETLFSGITRMNLNPPFNDWSCIGSQNGLICFDSRYMGMSNKHHSGPAYVCNPVTREYVVLLDTEGVYLWTGFGYSCETNEYKVVRSCFDSIDPNVGTAQVYTLGSGGGWRNVAKINNMNRKHDRQHGVFANGALHWENEHRESILAFHLTEEKFSELPLPPAGVPYISIELGVLGGFLSATYYREDIGNEIWLLKKNKETCDFRWSKEFSFDSNMQKPLEFTKSRRLLCYKNTKVYSYDLKASSAKVVSVDKFINQAIRHKNTLVSLRLLGERDTKTMESCERASSREETENGGKLKKRRTIRNL